MVQRYHYAAGAASDEMQEFCEIDAEGKELMRTAVPQLELSAHSYHRVLKLARTFTKWAQSAIADLAGEEQMVTQHLAEALQYRPRDLVSQPTMSGVPRCRASCSVSRQKLQSREFESCHAIMYRLYQSITA